MTRSNKSLGVRSKEPSQTLKEALDAFREGRFKDAADATESIAGKESSPDSKALILLLAGRSRAFLCEKNPDSGQCDRALALYESASASAAQCTKPEEFIPVRREKGELIGYSCNSLKTAASFFAERLKKNRPESGKTPEVVHTPTNFRVMDRKMQTIVNLSYSPPLSGTHYIRTHVYNAYDASTNRWISQFSNLRPYHREVQSSHRFEGRAIPREISIFYYGAGELFILPVPDGFAVDSGGVEVNGKKTGFDLLTDANGIVYCRLDSTSIRPPLVSFSMGKDNSSLMPSNEEDRSDLLPEMSLPGRLGELVGRTRFYDAASIYSATKSLVLDEFSYPQIRNIMSGEALLPLARTGLEFYEAISKMKVADCDVANSLGVIILRRQGVAARLVTGLLASEKGLGLHGWLEYWDDSLEEWVRGDMTPPLQSLEEKKKEPQPNDRYPYSEHTPLTLLSEVVSPFSVTNNKLDETLDRSWIFKGDGILESETQGRYLFERGGIKDAVRFYDLERGRFSSFPPRKSLLECARKSIFSGPTVIETADGPVIVEECRKPQHCESIAGDDDAECWNRRFSIMTQDGIERIISVHPSTISLPLPSRFPPYYYIVNFSGLDNRLSNTTWQEDPDGKFHLIVEYPPSDGENRYYYLPLNFRAGSNELTIKLEDLGTPVFSAPQSDEEYSSKAKFSPDASHFAIRKETFGRTGRALKREIIVYQDGREKYRYTTYTKEETAVFPDEEESEAERKEWFDLKVANDGSLDIKRIDDVEAFVWHVTSQGKEMPARHIKLPPDTGKLPSGYNDIPDISWDASWVYLKDGTYHRIVGNEVQPEKPSQISGGNCVKREEGVRCVDVTDSGKMFIAPTVVMPMIVDPLRRTQDKRQFVNFGEIIEEWKQGIGYQLKDSPIDKGLFWSWKIYQDSKVPLAVPIYRFVNSLEDRAAYELKEIIKRADDSPPSSHDVMARLGSLAQRPKAYLHYEWLILGAAFVFASRENCANRADTASCAAEINAIDQFLVRHGEGLAKRFLPDAKASAHFPNARVVSRASSLFLAGALRASEPRLAADILEKMISADTEKAAEAVLLGVENGSIAAGDIPELSITDEMMLREGLREALEDRRKRAVQKSRETPSNTLASREPIYRYAALESAVAERFGKEAVPVSSGKDW